MPRPNPPRDVLAEDHLARRIAAEREARNWTYDGLAKRMTDVGCPMNQSAIYKIEQVTPRRRITVDELVAFSRVFAIPVEQLLLPPEVAVNEEVGLRVLAWDRANDAMVVAQQAERQAWADLEAYVAEHPELKKRLGAMLRRWSEHFFEKDHDLRVARLMHKLTRDPAWAREAKQALAAIVETGE
jgi:transcriptional regulator with XRE-family HTH domain